MWTKIGSILLKVGAWCFSHPEVVGTVMDEILKKKKKEQERSDSDPITEEPNGNS
jgi:Mn-containing catalase